MAIYRCEMCGAKLNVEANCFVITCEYCGTSQSVGIERSDITALLERAFIFLEDGDWRRADEYFEKVLDLDAKCARAYVGKLMVEQKVTKQDSLKDCPMPFDDSNQYQKAVRFANKALKSILIGYIEHINSRNEQSRMRYIYTCTKKNMSCANTSDDYYEAARLFESILEYEDAAALARQCRVRAEALKKDEDEKKRIADLNAEIKATRIKNITIISSILTCVIIVFVILLNTVIIPNSKYKDAIALMDKEAFGEAIVAFELLDGYKDSVNKIRECEIGILDKQYDTAMFYMEKNLYAEAIGIFESLGEYEDSAEKIIECRYLNADALAKAGNFIEAYEIWKMIGEYKDSVEKANSIYLQYKQQKIETAKVGDTIFFGKYEQDNEFANGKEDIEWCVLDIQDGKALVISKYILDSKEYNDKTNRWQNSTLRSWLNGEFLCSAFSEEEILRIPTVTISTDRGHYNFYSGGETQDKVYVLSGTEAEKYFRLNQDRKCKATAYAKAQGAYVSSLDGNSWWVLRSPGRTEDGVVSVLSDGEINWEGGYVKFDDRGIRPVLWFDLKV